MINQFKVEVRRQLVEAYCKYQIDHNVYDVEISCKLRGRVAGRAARSYTTDTYSLEFNKEAIALHYDEMVKNTVPHEIAHLICYHNPRLGRNHDSGWKSVCRSLGGSDSRCHSMELTPGKRIRKFTYISDSGQSIDLTTIRHNRLQRGQVLAYTLRATSEQITRHHFAKSTTPSPVKAVRKPVRVNVPTNVGGSKKDRAQVIFDANPTMSRKDMINLFIQEVGLTKAGASTYYYNCKK